MLFKKKQGENNQTCRCPKCGEQYLAAYKFCPMCAYPNAKREKDSYFFPKQEEMSEFEMEPEVSDYDDFDTPDITIAKKAMSPDDEMEKLYE